MRIWISIIILSLSDFVFADDVSMDDIRSWAQNRPETAKGLSFYDSERIQKIGLTNKEIAYVLPVSLDHEGRNSMYQTALALPSRKEVFLFTGTEIKEVEKVLDADHDGISEVFVKKSGSGQGTEIGEKSIVQIDNYGRVTVLRKVRFETNEGVWGKKVVGYYQQDVNWVFTDSNMENEIKDLIETITVEKGRVNSDPLIEKSVTRYHFINAHLVKYELAKQ